MFKAAFLRIIAGFLVSLIAFHLQADLPTFVYVLCKGDNSISVIDTSINQVVDTITSPDFDRLEGIAFTPDGNWVYVTNFNTGTVSIIDAKTRKVSGSPISVGNHPIAIAIPSDGKLAYVTASNGGSLGQVSIIDLQVNQVVGSSIAVGIGPNSIAVTPDGKKVYAANIFEPFVSYIDTTSYPLASLAVGVGAQPYFVITSKDGSLAYVAIYPVFMPANGKITKIETASNFFSEFAQAPEGPVGLALAPNNKNLYVVNTLNNTVSVFATHDGSLITVIPYTTSIKYIAITPDGKYAYLPLISSDQVAVIDLKTNKFLDFTIQVGSQPNFLAITPLKLEQPSLLENLKYSKIAIQKNSR